MRFFAAPYLRIEWFRFSAFVEEYALQAGMVGPFSRGRSTVMDVLLARSRSEIVPTVIRSVVVYMIHFIRGPRAGHVKVRQSVRVEKLPIYADFSVLGAALHAFDASRLTLSRLHAFWRFDPMKLPGLWIVGHEVQQSFMCEHGGCLEVFA